MKRIITVIIIFFIIAVGLYAQDEQKAVNTVSVSSGFFGVELSYEKVLSPRLSVLGQVSYNTLFLVDSLSISGKGRLYPFAGAFFLEMGLGFSNGYNFTAEGIEFMADIFLGMLTLGLWYLSDQYKDKGYVTQLERQNGLLIQAGLGWNIDIGKRNHFKLPISMGVDFRLSKSPALLPYLRAGLGYSF